MNVLGWLVEVFTARRRLREAQDSRNVLILELDRCKRDLWATKDVAYENYSKYTTLRAQIIQVRASQSALARAGWEVMCFIPEEVLDGSRFGAGSAQWRWLVKKVAVELVDLALKGINRVRSNGRVCALVFEPLNLNEPVRAPSFVQALYDQEGKFKLSERAWDQRTEEQRVRNAAGCQ